MKALKIIALFLGCRLVWTWLDQCGADLGLGEALPFCLACNGLTTIVRLMILAGGAHVFYGILRKPADETEIVDPDLPPGRMYLIHWHRIALLLVIVLYPLWVWWIDRNTIIPGPQASVLTRFICESTAVKGTVIWSIVVTFIVASFGVLHKN